MSAGAPKDDVMTGTSNDDETGVSKAKIVIRAGNGNDIVSESEDNDKVAELDALNSRLRPYRLAHGLRATLCALAGALPLLLGAGTAAAEGTLPTVSVSDAEVYEDDGRMTFEVTLSRPSSEQVTVQLSTSDGTATSGTDFQAASWTVTFGPNWTGPYRVSLAVHDDQQIEPDETFSVTLTNPVGATLGDATATGTIRNDDTAATLTASDIEDTTATLTIGGHTDGWWYKGKGYSRGFEGNVHPCTAVTAGTTSVSISGLTAAVSYDHQAYSDSTCSTRLAKVRFRTLAPEGTPAVSVSDAEVSEDRTWMTFLVSLTQPSREQVTVDVHTSAGTATMGTDFRAVSWTLTFPANSRRPQLVVVLVYDDQVPEPDETFTVTLTNPTGATLGDATATGTIRDDGDKTLTASNIEDTTATLTIGDHTDGWWFKGNAHPCTAVTAGTAAVSIGGLTTVTRYEYGAYSDSSCRKKMASVEFRTLAPEGTPTVNVSDAQTSEGGAWMTFWVSLSAPSREQVTVDVHTSDGTAASGTDFRAVSRTLTFPANSGDPLPVQVILHDDQESGPDETFTVTLTNPVGATLGDATATGTIKDDDSAQGTIPLGLVSATATPAYFKKEVGEGGSFGWISGWRLWLIYNEPLDNASVPATGDFVLKVDGSPLAVGRVSIEQRFGYVLLDMPSQTLWDDQAVTLSYTPGTNPIQDTTGNVAPTLIDLAVIVDEGLPPRPSAELPPSGRRPVADAGGVEQVAGTGGVQIVGTGTSVTLDGSGSSDPDGDSLTFAWAQRPLHGEITGPGGEVVDKGGKVFLTGAHAVRATFVAPKTPGLLYFELTVSDPSGRADGDSVLVEVRDLEAGDAPDFGAEMVAAMTLTSGAAMEPLVLPEATGGNGELTYSLTSRSRPANLALTPVVSASPPPGLSFDPATRTLSGTPTTNGTWSVSYTAVDADDDTRDSDTALQVFTIEVLEAPPAATGVALASDPGDDATYAAGDTVRVAVTFDEAVTVDTAEGAPRLKLDLGGKAGSGERWATYASGSGATTLEFVYTAVSGDISAVGVAVLADTLELDGGTIRSAATQAAAALGHPGLAPDAEHKVDADSPRLLRGEIDGGTMTLFFSEALDPDWTGGRFDMAVEVPETGVVGFRAMGGVTVEGATVTVGMGERYPRATAGLDRNSVRYFRRADGADGSLRDLAGNPVETPHRSLLHRQGGTVELRFVKIDLANVTGTGSSVTGVAVVSDAGADDTYALGETIRVEVTFAEAVEVDTSGGTPRVKIRMDPRWGEFWAAYESGSGTNALTFAYRVAEPNTAPTGVAVLANTLEANGGTIRSAATRANANLAHAGLGHDSAHKVDWRLSPLANGAPAVTGVAVVSDAGDDDTYAIGEKISVRLTFAEAVDVSGTPRVKIKMDPRWGEFWASYKSGSGTAALTFVHTVAKPNTSPTGIAVLANTLQLNGGTIASAATQANANLAHAGLDHDSSHKVDWRLSPPGTAAVTAVAVISDAGADDTYMLGETIRVRLTFGKTMNVSGTPRMKIKMDPRWGEKWAAYESGSGTAALTFAWTVVEPNYAPQGIAVLANTLQLNGGTIRSSAGTDAALRHAGLGHDARHKVDWRPTLSVADAHVNEGADAVAFEVSLNRTFSGTAHRVTVNYATADGTAKAGEDYTATSGSLTFAAGERVKTVRVPLLDDAIDEGEETFTLRLSNARGARIGDGEATGTIANADPLQKMWLSRFGRTVASHVTDAVSDRLSTPLAGAQVTVGGQRVDLAATEDEKWVAEAMTSVARALGAPNGPEPGGPGWGSPGSGLGQAWAGPGPGSGTSLGIGGSSTPGSTTTRDLSGRELLLGSAFHLAAEGEGGRPGLAAWGRVTVGGFDGEAPADDGTVRIDGDVTTGILGADAKWNRLLAGVAVSVSEGKGTFAQPGVDSGKIESTMTTVSPYARFSLNDRLSVWGLAGWGTGDMTIVQAANDNGQPERVTRTDLEMRLAAIGGRGALLKADEAGGFDLALKADAFYVETESEAVSNEGSTTGAASRVRLALEGSLALETGGGTFTPGLEIGLRHDGGDAETGTGVELGGQLTWADADSGLSAEARVRTLIAHEDSGYKEWGASGSVRLDPGERGRGLLLSLSPTWGAASSGVGRLWSARDARGLAPGQEFEAEQRLEGELGYGMSVLGDRFTGTPNLGFGLSDTVRDYRIGWRLTSAVRGDPGFEVNLGATRREATNDNEPAEHGVMLRGAIRW